MISDGLGTVCFIPGGVRILHLHVFTLYIKYFVSPLDDPTNSQNIENHNGESPIDRIHCENYVLVHYSRFKEYFRVL